jgi:molybdate transport system substrate-binding protein
MLAIVGLIATGCSDSKKSDVSAASSTAMSSSSSAPTATGKITVSAASSLTDAFNKIGKDFQTANPGASVAFNFGSSGTLATQIQQGAPADSFASADTTNMDKLKQANLVDGQPVVFATNQLVIVTKPGNPKNVHSLADLANVGTVSLCSVDGSTPPPCGKYAAQVLQMAGVNIPESSITRGQDVKTTLAAVTTGDAEAAIVYVSDAQAAGNSVASVTIPTAQNVIATYPIAVLAASGNKATAQAFIDYVMSPAGQSTLQSYGFLPPT